MIGKSLSVIVFCVLGLVIGFVIPDISTLQLFCVVTITITAAHLGDWLWDK